MVKRNYIPSFLIAYLLSIGGINQLMGIVLDKSDGIMIMNLIPVAALLALHFFLSDKKHDLNMDKKALLFVYYIVSVIVVYKYAAIYTTFSAVEVIVYCFIPIYVSFYKIDVEKLLKFVIFFSILVVPVSNEFFKTIERSYETIGMSTTYNVLPFVVAAILHFWYYRKSAGAITWIGYGVNVYYLIKAVLYGNRGPVISLMVLIVLLYLHKVNKDGVMKKNGFRTVFVTIAVGVAAISVVGNIEDIIYWLYKWLKSMNIEIAAVSKSVAKMAGGDLSNGREELYRFVWNGIKEGYLLGNGISSIAYKSYGRISYPHNLVLQMWYDLGILVSIPLLWITVKSVFKTFFKNCLKKECAVILMLVCTLSIPRLCYSAEFWTSIPFWLLIMYTISPNIYGVNNTGEDEEDEDVEDGLKEEELVRKYERY